MGAVLNVEHPGAGHNHHAVPGEPVPPAKIDVVAAAGQRWVEPVQLFPDIASDQHARRIDRERVGAGVVLPLVDFVGVNQGESLSPAAR
ncbi:hypothetical protein PJL18_04437 [Paenarthrobacter nicotinovorans]|nr:hypothetical protein [Paenarthrobacter nicotinovorans]